MNIGIKTTALLAAAGTLFFGGVGCAKNSTESASVTTASATSTSTEPVKKEITIQDYIKQNQITEVAVKPTDRGVPVIGLPYPPGWVNAGANTPPWSFGAILFTTPADVNNPPNVIAAMSKLTGNVDPAQILEYAPNEMRNMGGFAPIGNEVRLKISGYDAVQSGGTYIKNDTTRAIIQTTVAIPAADGVYVLQMNADAPAGEENVLADATKVLNDNTRITP
jgi:hypothetical protein